MEYLSWVSKEEVNWIIKRTRPSIEANRKDLERMGTVKYG